LRWLKPISLIAIILLLVSALVVGGSKVGPIHWTPLAIKEVRLSSVLVYQDREEFDRVMQLYMNKSLLSVDVELVRKTVEQLPWISSAAVAKVWPGTLTVDVTEYQPVAVWNGHKVLNSEGLALERPVSEMVLAQLNGPEFRAFEVMEHYLQFAQVIDSLDAQVKEVTLHPRGAWQLEITGGISIALGDRNVLERSRRVVDVIKAHDNLERIQTIDARYPNGVAISYQANEETEVQQ
jgi:cell division protein FtsQ